MPELFTGQILKMKTSLEEGRAFYTLNLGESSIQMNSLVGGSIRLEFTGEIRCIATGEKIKKTYAQGYSYKAFSTLPQCDICIVKPELCHFEKGTCRDPKWGEKHCFKPHIIYLSLTSGPKVGITRQTQVPTRWIDQGATQAIPLARVKNRLQSGLVEQYLTHYIGDKTNWRKMLQGEEEKIDLEYLRDEMLGHLEMSSLEYEELEDEPISITYPVEEYPQRIKSLSFDKSPLVQGKLLGIKGQYLILDSGVFNIRRHQGYFTQLLA